MPQVQAKFQLHTSLLILLKVASKHQAVSINHQLDNILKP